MTDRFTLPELPWAADALDPHITANTIGFHHGKHHAAYVKNLNGMIEGTDLKDLSLEEIMRKTSGDAAKKGIFNNSAQIWNHTFYWRSMKPGGGGAPAGALATQIDAAFGDYAAFKAAFHKAAATLFGSGWAWLCDAGGKLEIVQTKDADSPICHGKKPLITIDVWEHAYYLDFQNRRPDYITTFLDSLVNWDYAQENLEKKEITV